MNSAISFLLNLAAIAAHPPEAFLLDASHPESVARVDAYMTLREAADEWEGAR